MPANTQSLSEQLEEKVYNALRLWHAPDLKGNPLHQLRMMKMLQREGSDERQASNQLLAEEIERLKTSHQEIRYGKGFYRQIDNEGSQCIKTRCCW